MNRTYILGAGFSKAVADGPLMCEIWDYILTEVKEYKSDNPRKRWFSQLDSSINKFEENAKARFKGILSTDTKHTINDIRENIEYLLTIVDLHLLKESPQNRFSQPGVDWSPYPILFCPATVDLSDLKIIKAYLIHFLYVLLVKLKNNETANEFAKIIDRTDNFITFNYDIVLEKVLWDRGIWSPLNGYVGVTELYANDDMNKLNKANLYSDIKIHKMHGSVNWENNDIAGIPSPHYKKVNTIVKMDNREQGEFFFDGLDILLNREPEGRFSDEQKYLGKHKSPNSWMLPSFIKTFERIEFYKIWQSSFRTMSQTEELVIIGYSFRDEDSNAFLLLSQLPISCVIKLVDPHPYEIINRLERKGFMIYETNVFKKLEEYIDCIN